MVEGLIVGLARQGIRLHGFGFKLRGLRHVGRWLALSDSMAWSYRGRRGGRGSSCTHTNPCNHCLPFALEWREKALAAIARGERRGYQERLWPTTT